MFKYAIFKTKLGYMGVVSSPKGLHMVILPRGSDEEVKRALEEHYTVDIYRDEKKLAGVVKKIKNYMDGKKVVFKEDFDVAGATPFEIKVWDTVFGIPPGEVRTYG